MGHGQGEYSSQVIANQFLKLAEKEERPLTNMQLQKLVFLADGFALAFLDRAITYHTVHAWTFGPVMPDLYEKLRKYGNGSVTELLDSPDNEELAIVRDEEAQDIIKAVWSNYGDKTASQLSRLTHLKGSPWDMVWNVMGRHFDMIHKEIIRAYYKEKIA